MPEYDGCDAWTCACRDLYHTHVCPCPGDGCVLAMRLCGGCRQSPLPVARRPCERAPCNHACITPQMPDLANTHSVGNPRGCAHTCLATDTQDPILDPALCSALAVFDIIVPPWLRTLFHHSPLRLPVEAFPDRVLMRQPYVDSTTRVILCVCSMYHRNLSIHNPCPVLSGDGMPCYTDTSVSTPDPPFQAHFFEMWGNTGICCESSC